MISLHHDGNVLCSWADFRNLSRFDIIQDQIISEIRIQVGSEDKIHLCVGAGIKGKGVVVPIVSIGVFRHISRGHATDHCTGIVQKLDEDVRVITVCRTAQHIVGVEGKTDFAVRENFYISSGPQDVVAAVGCADVNGQETSIGQAGVVIWTQPACDGVGHKGGHGVFSVHQNSSRTVVTWGDASVLRLVAVTGSYINIIRCRPSPKIFQE